jgi:hypothetical protein
MPKLFEYLGLILRFYSNDHEPIHVHAFYKEFQTKIDFEIVDGIITKINYSEVAGYQPIPNTKIKDLEDLIATYKYDIIQMWIKFFVLHEKITTQKITKKLK